MTQGAPTPSQDFGQDFELASLMMTFAVIARQGNLTQAATQTGISKSQLSKQLKALEGRLGVRLVQRSSRGVTPTEAGLLLLERAEALGAAVEAVRESQDTLSGHLRISAPLSFGQRFLNRPLVSFLAEHPQLSATVELSDSQVDVLHQSVDLSIRVGPVGDPDLIVRKLCDSKRWVVGSRELVESLGPIRHPTELARLPCLLYTHQATRDRWVFEVEGKRVEVPVTGRFRCNNGDLLAEAAVAGLGLAWLPDFIVKDDVAAGRLQVLFSSQCVETTAVNAVLPSRVMVPKKVRALLEHLERSLALR